MKGRRERRVRGGRQLESDDADSQVTASILPEARVVTGTRAFLAKTKGIESG